ncbi:transposase family protein [Streptomyces sp. NPDC057494]|uniref:transposase family protein n=1 Tax=Streptomyces sp. NPDC057494 TaxID=3346148 RepID=UPI00369D465B
MPCSSGAEARKRDGRRSSSSRRRWAGAEAGERGTGEARFISGKNKQNAVKFMVVIDAKGCVLWCSPAEPGICANSTHARQLGLVKLLAGGPTVEILTDAGYPGLGAQTAGRVVTPPHRKFKKDAPDGYEEMYERQRKAHSSRRIRVEHGIAHLKNWRSLTRHLGRREHMSDNVQAVAGLLSHQQTVDLIPARQR